MIKVSAAISSDENLCRGRAARSPRFCHPPRFTYAPSPLLCSFNGMQRERSVGLISPTLPARIVHRYDFRIETASAFETNYLKPQRASDDFRPYDNMGNTRGHRREIESAENRRRTNRLCRAANCSSINKISEACVVSGASDIPLFGKLEGAV